MSDIRGRLGADSIGELASSLLSKAVRPVALRIAELFMTAIVGIYVAKLIVLGIGFSSGYGFREAALVSFVVDTALMFMTVDSLLTLSSADPRSWKKAVRAAVLLVVVNLLYRMGISATAAGIVSFNPVLVAAVSVIVLACLFDRRVRGHFVPPGLDLPPLRSWVAYAAFWPLFPSEHYRMAFGAEGGRGPDDLG